VIIEKLTFRGNPHIGVYIFANDLFTLVPYDADEKFCDFVSRILQTPVVKVSIGDTGLIGIFVVGNNKGLLLPPITKEYELLNIKRSLDINIAVVKTKYTALGNIVLVNDKAALVSPEAFDELKKPIIDVLQVETVEKGTIAGLTTVGSAAYVNNVAGLAHPETTEKELEFLSDIFEVPFDVGTVNFGVGFIKSGLVGNSKGLLVGERTTGPEILRISKMFGGAR
jgi:translation initiation factor 6